MASGEFRTEVGTACIQIPGIANKILTQLSGDLNRAHLVGANYHQPTTLNEFVGTGISTRATLETNVPNQEDISERINVSLLRDEDMILIGKTVQRVPIYETDLVAFNENDVNNCIEELGLNN
ncbi:hypothetical protein EIN_429840 [Entamoeba invadens IP1]|uniref:Uncharacterized protein n=1 Tax=Entamoeba invadens IP1 TaxID=370355 RepID=A0A0A1UFE2_ENTIV|nr:hypothetical protein EIN_429840 [Entamoeba invadens IP1]ELP95208.1 hypothetical protein EIN_429840 [Entamoeba invadens IP1]|eukprot:XP_004261979.1 hypothetical protein EIN_429840 [Entamoeba invadens IP1]